MTSGNPCFGGILADDQGLGKTVSTIALILTERSTPSLPCEEDSKNRGSDQFDHSQVVFNKNKVGEDNLCKKKEPAAGTLIVCPTSLMRQLADELRNKVTLGLNMVAACHVLMLDLWLNPITEDQETDRAHRNEQTRPVRVVRFTVKDTIEDCILALQVS